MGAASTLSSTIVYHIEPDSKGPHANLAGRHKKKWQQYIPNPACISDPIAVV